jgi:hypothetical protein
MSSVCHYIQPEVFYKHESFTDPDDKISSLIRCVIKDHECFSTTYRYAPIKDQNFSNKIRSNNHKSLFSSKITSVDDEQRKIFSILNKLTESNFEKLFKKIVTTLCSNPSIMIRFSEEMMKYCTQSDTHINLIVHIVENTPMMESFAEHFIEVFENHVNEYKESVTISAVYKNFENFDYDNYDDFCMFTKFSKEKLNSLKSIIKVSNAIVCDVDIFLIFKEHIDRVNNWCVETYHNRHLFVYLSLEHIDYMLNNTEVKDLMENDIQQLHMSCIDVLEEFQGLKKIEFKVRDIMEKCCFDGVNR